METEIDHANLYYVPYKCPYCSDMCRLRDCSNRAAVLMTNALMMMLLMMMRRRQIQVEED